MSLLNCRWPVVLAAQVSAAFPLAAAEAQAPELKLPAPCDAWRVISPGMEVQAGRNSQSPRKPTKLRALVLGEQRAAAWLETSVFQAGAAMVGYRVAEVNFRPPESAAREIASLAEAGRSFQISNSSIQEKSGFLEFAVAGNSTPIRVSYTGSSQQQFAIANSRPASIPPPAAYDRKPEQKTLQLLPLTAAEGAKPGAAPFQISVLIRSAGADHIEFAGQMSLTFGPFAAKAEAVLPVEDLGGTNDAGRSFAGAVSQWLSGERPAGLNAPILLNNGKLCSLWFKDEDRVLVVDLLRLQRALLARFLAEEQTSLTEYDFKEREFLAASRTLGRLLLADAFADAIAGELGTQELTSIKTANSNARSRLEELVFRLPVKTEAESWVVYYNPRTKKARLLPDHVQWLPAAAPGDSNDCMQFKVPNRPLVFMITARAEPGFDMPAEKISALQKQLAEQYQAPSLMNAKLETGIPEQFTGFLALDPDGVTKLSSAKLEICRRDARNRLFVKLTATESDAFTLRELYLSKDGKGLPLDLSIDQFFLGRTSEKAGAIISGRLKAPDFRIVEAKDQKIALSVWVDAAVFDRSKATKVPIAFRYPGETTTYSVEIARETGSGTLEVPLKTLNGETVLDLEYQSPVNKTWILREGAVEGLVLVDE